MLLACATHLSLLMLHGDTSARAWSSEGPVRGWTAVRQCAVVQRQGFMVQLFKIGAPRMSRRGRRHALQITDLVVDR